MKNKNFYIQIAQRFPDEDSQKIRRIYFDSEALARAAYKKAKAFWQISDKTAVEVEGTHETIIVSTDIISSVSLHIGSREIASRKKSK